jgi:hypothetical protein
MRCFLVERAGDLIRESRRGMQIQFSLHGDDGPASVCARLHNQIHSNLLDSEERRKINTGAHVRFLV